MKKLREKILPGNESALEQLIKQWRIHTLAFERVCRQGGGKMTDRINYLSEVYIDGTVSPDEIVELVDLLETEAHREEFAEFLRFKGLISCLMKEEELECWQLARKIMESK